MGCAVASHAASQRSRRSGEATPARWEEAFFRAIQRREFLPNSPTLMNAGTEIGQLAACFVLPVEDTLASVFEAVKEMAVIHQSGGGTGFDFSALRPAGDVVQGTPGVASGPVAFMGVFDAATAVVKQGGRRRGANMGVLRVDHPDVREFIRVKSDRTRLTNFNISLATPDRFWQAVEAGARFDLVNPRDGRVVRSVDARELLDEIAKLRVGQRRPRRDLHRRGEPREPDAPARPARRHQPVRRAAAAAERSLQPRLAAPRRLRARRRDRLGCARRAPSTSACASSTT